MQTICGPKVNGFEPHTSLLVEGCNVESERDTLGCHWQDMLLPHYIQASRVSAWPLAWQCFYKEDPMSIDDTAYSSSIADDLDTVISFLQPGVQEISRKCGPQVAKRLRLLLNKTRHLQRNALKYIALCTEDQYRTTVMEHTFPVSRNIFGCTNEIYGCCRHVC